MRSLALVLVLLCVACTQREEVADPEIQTGDVALDPVESHAPSEATPELSDSENYDRFCSSTAGQLGDQDWQRQNYCDRLIDRMLQDVREREALPQNNAQPPSFNPSLEGPPAGPAESERVCDYSNTPDPVIKGNVAYESGERIYHVPGGEFYGETVINPAYGEGWFCTELDAQEAGWRRSTS